jgi:hypothetical protein
MARKAGVIFSSRWLGTTASLLLLAVSFAGWTVQTSTARAELMAAKTQTVEFPSTAEVLKAVVEGAKVKTWPEQPPRIANPARRKECDVHIVDKVSRVCIHGDSEADKTVVVYGDSQGWMWIPAFDVIGKQEHWRVAQLTKPACPVADYVVFTRAKKREYTECAAFRKFALEQIAEIQPDLVLLASSFRSGPVFVDGEGVNDPEIKEPIWDKGLGEMIDRIMPSTKRIIVIGEMAAPSVDGNECLEEHPDDVPACNTPREKAVQTDHNAHEKQVALDHGADYVDVIPWFCTEDICPAVIGGLTVHIEKFHVSENYAVWLSQPLGEATALIPDGARLHRQKVTSN